MPELKQEPPSPFARFVDWNAIKKAYKRKKKYKNKLKDDQAGIRDGWKYAEQNNNPLQAAPF